MSRRRRAQLIRWAVYAGTVLVLVWIVWLVDWDRLQRAMFDGDLIGEQFPDIVTKFAFHTLIFTTFGFLGGLLLGLILALMRLSSLRPYRWFATGYIEVFRGLPMLLTVIFIGFGLPIALDVQVPFTYGPGSLALAIVAGAYMAETIRAGIEAVPKGQMEAARSLGMTHSRAMITIVIPQAFRIIIPPLTNELVMLLKDSSLLAVLGVTTDTKELTGYAREQMSRNFNATPLVVAGFVYLLMTIPLTRVAALIERRGKRSR